MGPALSPLGLMPPSPRLPLRARAVRAGGGLSVLFHLATLSVIVVTAAWRQPPLGSSRASRTEPPLQLPRMVFLQQPGSGGGGGGGGNRNPNPPSRARAKGRDPLTVLAKKSSRADLPPNVVPPPPQPMLEVKPLASDTVALAGLPTALPSMSISQGHGVGGGVGDGTGSGVGTGTGAGMGPGSGGGFGGGVHRLGSGVVPPTLVREVKPKYTAEAMRLRIQGTVTLEVIVGRDGVPRAIRVTRSLDPGGLDEEAVAAAREWRFTPGRLGDTPVDVLVTILLDFNGR